MALLLLDHDGRRAAAREDDVDQRATVLDHVVDLALGNGERASLGAAGVDDAGNEALAAQAPSRARAEVRALGDVEGWAIGGHGRVRIEKGGWLRLGWWPTTTRSRRAVSGARRSSGTALGTQATRYAGTKAANVARSEESASERLEARHLETAEKMARALGEMKGAAMKLGQLASFIDTEFLPPEYAEIYQEKLAQAAHTAAADAVEEGRQGPRGGVRGRPARRAVRGHRGGGLRGGVDRPGPPRHAARRPRGRGEDPVPGRGRGAGSRPARTPA